MKSFRASISAKANEQCFSVVLSLFSFYSVILYKVAFTFESVNKIDPEAGEQHFPVKIYLFFDVNLNLCLARQDNEFKEAFLLQIFLVLLL